MAGVPEVWGLSPPLPELEEEEKEGRQETSTRRSE